MTNTTTKMMIAAIGLSAALPAAVLAAPAQPGTALTAVEKQVKVSVPYKDIDLSTAAGQRTLQQRLADAGRSACSAAFADQPFAAQQVHNCLNRARDTSRQELAAAMATTQTASRGDAQVAGHQRH